MKKLFPLIAAVSIIGLQACGAGVSKSALEETIAAGIAQTQTMESGLEKGVNATLTAMGKGGVQGTPSKATATLATATLTSAPPTETPTSGLVTVTVSADTWCSKGPGSVYDHVFVFKVGQTAKVIGREEFNNYWVIEKPDNPAITCWLWGKYATLTGDPSTLPVIAPPPTPTPEITSGIVTAVSITVAHAKIISNVNITCPFDQSFTVSITTNGLTTVKYSAKWNLPGEQNVVWNNKQMVFSSAGTQNWSDTWSPAGCGHWTMTVSITSPNPMTAQAEWDVVK